MPIATTLTPPTRAPPDSPAPKNTFGLTDVQNFPPAKSCRCKLELLFSPPVPHTPSIQHHVQSTTDSEHDANSIVPQGGEAEDEYTLSGYGDISLGEVIVPPLPSPCRSPGFLQPRIAQPRLRLKVRRPPMPKRRLSYTYFPDPLPLNGGMESDECWPGSPRPITNSPSWLQHQPLVSPLPADPTSPRTHGKKPVKNGASLEKLIDELLPHSPSIRLSPPGSPASQALSLPQETYEQKNDVRQGQNLPEASDAAVKLPQTPPAPAPAPQQAKPWRTRLPPRPPIPKWDT